MGLLPEFRREWNIRGSKGVVQYVLETAKTSTSMSMNNGMKAEVFVMAILQKSLTLTSCKDSASFTGRQHRGLVSQDADSRLDAQLPAWRQGMR